MTNEPTREEVNIRIDQIITRALLITSYQQKSDPLKNYDGFRLHELVIAPILRMLFEHVDYGTKDLFYSRVGGMGRCVRVLSGTEKVYTCNDCSPNIPKSLCEECFRRSKHVKHHFSESSVKYDVFCHCGDSEAYMNDSPCCEYQIPDNSRNMPPYFVERIKNIIRRLLYYLELLCGYEPSLDTHVEWLLMSDNLSKLTLVDNPSGFISSVLKKKDNINCNKWCVLIFRQLDECSANADSCVRFVNPPGTLADLLLDFKSHGYLCAKYKDTFDNCQTLKARIQLLIKDSLPGSALYCQIVKVYRLFFIKLSSNIIHFIHDTCLMKSELCDVMSEILFTETSLLEKILFNQTLWDEIRSFITCNIFLTALFSRKGERNLSEFYLNHFDRLYSGPLVKSDSKLLLYPLVNQLLSSKTQFRHLVEKGFLCKILDFLSCKLRSLGFSKGESISRVLKNIGPKAVDPIHGFCFNFSEILYLPGKSIESSGQVKSELQKTAMRLIQLCDDFDDMEPHLMKDTYQEGGISPYDVCTVHSMLADIFVPFVIMILKFDDISNMILSEFVRVFKQDLERQVANLSAQKAVEKLLTSSDIQKKPSSIFNLSTRLFFDILTECVVRSKLNDELKKAIFGDQMLLMWISRPAITSLSLKMYVEASFSLDPQSCVTSLTCLYHLPMADHYLFV
ncbi:E3 ubiquitin-protein ligase UBR1 [Thelohanellus kitauei]|uniref:E3 ubiquitin-protein ligase n=1 Tax=Thelohanellus kitauei TaxID=669202 RepID=A0A0C2J6Z1_THEKT|nr:E3 ubiquitin-protein ligase UBR1 [Thelohanellus kitauei]